MWFLAWPSERAKCFSPTGFRAGSGNLDNLFSSLYACRFLPHYDAFRTVVAQMLTVPNFCQDVVASG